jgi:hypothetical protein
MSNKKYVSVMLDITETSQLRNAIQYATSDHRASQKDKADWVRLYLNILNQIITQNGDEY